jgi:hypothetical protein
MITGRDKSFGYSSVLYQSRVGPFGMPGFYEQGSHNIKIVNPFGLHLPMKSLLVLVALLACGIQAGNPIHQYCLEELKREHPYSSATVDRLYAQTGEDACFDLKVHVARCLDRSLYTLIQATDSDQLRDKSKVPSVELTELERSMAHYLNVDLLPGFKDVLSKCSHPEQKGGLFKKVISVGDFSKRCDCDFGNEDHCLAYKHVGEVMNCGNAEPAPMVL